MELSDKFTVVHVLTGNRYTLYKTGERQYMMEGFETIYTCYTESLIKQFIEEGTWKVIDGEVVEESPKNLLEEIKSFCVRTKGEVTVSDDGSYYINVGSHNLIKVDTDEGLLDAMTTIEAFLKLTDG